MSEKSHTPKTAIAIMAAGKGTRLKSKHPKVLHEVGGKPLLAHVIASARKVAAAEDIYAIIGHEADLVQRNVRSARSTPASTHFPSRHFSLTLRNSRPTIRMASTTSPTWRLCCGAQRNGWSRCTPRILRRY